MELRPEEITKIIRAQIKNYEAKLQSGETGTVIDGKEIVYTEARFGISAQKVRDGLAPAAKFKTKNGYTGTANNSGSSSTADFIEVPLDAMDELPFN